MQSLHLASWPQGALAEPAVEAGCPDTVLGETLPGTLQPFPSPWTTTPLSLPLTPTLLLYNCISGAPIRCP